MTVEQAISAMRAAELEDEREWRRLLAIAARTTKRAELAFARALAADAKVIRPHHVRGRVCPYGMAQRRDRHHRQPRNPDHLDADAGYRVHGIPSLREQAKEHEARALMTARMCDMPLDLDDRSRACRDPST